MITLVILPGMDGSGIAYESFIAALGSGVSVKVVQYPATEPLGYPQLESIARAALPAGPFVLLGESFSGPVATSLAASAPAGLRGLVLCCSFVSNPRPLFSGLRALAGMLPLSSVPAGLLDYFLLGTFATPALRSALAENIARVSAPVLRGRLLSVMSADVSDRLPAVRVPILYLRGSRDRVVPSGASKRVVRFNPNARVVEFEAPHLLLQVVPLEAARAVGGFLREAENSH